MLIIENRKPADFPENQPLQIVLDLETFDTAYTAEVISIGAVAICGDSVIGCFYANTICPANGDYTQSEETVKWWNKLSNAKAFEQTKAMQVSSLDGATMFAEWVCRFGQDFNLTDAEVWGYSQDFDVSILKHMLDTENVEWPFKFYNHRCLRTLAASLGLKVNRSSGTHHNALDDARNQAALLIDCNNYIDKMKKTTLLQMAPAHFSK